MEENEIRQLPQQSTKKKRDRIGMVLYIFYVLLLVLTVLVIAKLVYFQLIWKPEPRIAGALTPSIVKRTVEPVRGNIIDCNGRLLAMSYPIYDIHMDCTVMKAEYGKMKNREKGQMKEQEWMEKARLLSQGLAELVPGTNAEKMFSQIKEGRARGRKYLPVAKGVDRSTMLKIKDLPLYKEGANKGGMIVETRNVRKYPYGRLARRTIGFVRDNKGLPEEEIKGNPGLEGRYDAILHGKDGREYLKQTDRGRVRNYDSSYVRAVDGKDLRTTLNIDYQDVADRALRERIDSLEDLNGACLVLMEVKTGAIRAMVNLSRDPNRGNSFEEITNFAIGRRCEPGSVFKTVTLLSVMSDGIYKSLDETIPTNHGIVKNTKMKQDVVRLRPRRPAHPPDSGSEVQDVVQHHSRHDGIRICYRGNSASYPDILQRHRQQGAHGQAISGGGHRKGRHRHRPQRTQRAERIHLLTGHRRHHDQGAAFRHRRGNGPQAQEREMQGRRKDRHILRHIRKRTV